MRVVFVSSYELSLHSLHRAVDDSHMLGTQLGVNRRRIGNIIAGQLDNVFQAELILIARLDPNCSFSHFSFYKRSCMSDLPSTGLAKIFLRSRRGA